MRNIFRREQLTSIIVDRTVDAHTLHLEDMTGFHGVLCALDDGRQSPAFVLPEFIEK